jgi:hypothetical protein
MTNALIPREQANGPEASPARSFVPVHPQDPLPDGSFFHRRLIVYLLALGSLGLNGLAAFIMHELGHSHRPMRSRLRRPS